MPHFNSQALLFKRLAVFLALVLSFINSNAQVFTVDTLMRNGNRSNRINMVYLADGYQAAELGTFITNATTINNAVFAQSPFQQYKNYFNSFAVRVPSSESGGKHPRTASDCPSLASHPVINPNNYFQSTFDYFSIHRLLVPLNNAGVYSVLGSNIPDYDQAFIVVNSPYYGGSGGTLATASTDPSSTEVAIHEIGHSFANLADEYWAGDVYAAEKANMTANNNPATVKWKEWLGINSTGIYPYGASGNPANWFRPHQTCKMQFLGFAFCSVCKERFIDRIHQLVTMADAFTPASTSFTLNNTNDVNFTMTPIQTIPSTIVVNWYLNGSATAFATNQLNVTVPYTSFVNGNNTIRAEVVDNTNLSKTYLPAAGYINNVTWNVNRPVVVPVRLRDFSGRLWQNAGLINWEIDSPEDLDHFELEKSNDGVAFTKFASVNGLPAKKRYTHTDEQLYSANTYYRLKSIEKNGFSFYSGIIRLQKPIEKFSYKVYQDAEQHRYRLTTNLDAPSDISMMITDASGGMIMNKNFGKKSNQFNHDFDLAGKPAGIYFMKLNIGGKIYNIEILAK